MIRRSGELCYGGKEEEGVFLFNLSKKALNAHMRVVPVSSPTVEWSGVEWNYAKVKNLKEAFVIVPH